MKKELKIGLDFIIDKQTNSIENVDTKATCHPFQKPNFSNMKTKSKELDVDFIGGQDKPLTKEEQSAISAFIKQLKEKQNKSSKRKSLKTEKEIA